MPDNSDFSVLRCAAKSVAANFAGGLYPKALCGRCSLQSSRHASMMLRMWLTLTNHYLFEPVACTPASGWEKGQVENQVGNVREWLFTPLACFASFADLNHWLATRCKELVQRSHPMQKQRTIAACFADEQPLLRPITAHFDGYVEQMMRVSSTCLVRVDRNRYSVPASAAGQAVSVRTTADQIRVVAHGEVIAAHPRVFG